MRLLIHNLVIYGGYLSASQVGASEKYFFQSHVIRKYNCPK